jgi:acetoin utilization deacetylase AcuC-like enzyme
VAGERHVLVVANETAAGSSLIDALERQAEKGPIRVTVVAPINQPRHGQVVYQDTRRASAHRRLQRTVALLNGAGIPAHSLVVESDPVSAVRDALELHDVDEIVVSTHPQQKSGWLRRDVVDRIRTAAGGVPVEHVVVDRQEDHPEANVLVIANETVVGDPLLDRIRARAREAAASFLIISPQSDPGMAEHPEAERRLRRALAVLRSEGIDAHGQVAHPDPFTAAMHAVHDERVDEIIVSTFPGERSGWLRRDLVGRLRSETGVPVEHVVTEAAEVGASA